LPVAALLAKGADPRETGKPAKQARASRSRNERTDAA
jgi:hypothetical protein